MLTIVAFTFNPFQENTYLAYTDDLEAIIWDPGCYTPEEKATLKAFIEEKGLTIKHLINTHCHIDHVLGNRFVSETYNVPLAIPKGELQVLEAVPVYGENMGFKVEKSPDPEVILEEGQVITLGSHEFKLLYCPGHSPASLCFLEEEEGILIGGDVLFQGSIGRTDLPGGDYKTLMTNIETKLMTLKDEVKVYPGHGPSTTIGEERKGNPFFLEWMRDKA